MILKEKSQEIFDIVKEGGRVATTTIVEAVGRNARSVSANVNDLVKKGLVVRDVVMEGDVKTTFVCLTEAGMSFVPSEDAE